jgi:hypothetical protein
MLYMCRVGKQLHLKRGIWLLTIADFSKVARARLPMSHAAGHKPEIMAQILN